jgi:hypothetical protein
MLSNSVKQFIEKNISVIEEEEFDMLYDEAYEWLADDRVRELTKILSSTLNIDAKNYALKNIMKHFEIEVDNFLQDEDHSSLYLHTFVRMYMNHTNGIPFHDFEQACYQYLINKKLLPNSKFNDGSLLLVKGR